MGRLTVISIWAVLVLAVITGTTEAQAADQTTSLQWRHFEVSPKSVSPGGMITIDAMVANVGDHTVTGLRLLPGVSIDPIALTSTVPSWRVVSSERDSYEAALEPGQVAHLRVILQISEPGLLKVGAALVADQASLPPRASVIRVASPRTIAVQVTVLSAVFFLTATILLAVVRWCGSGRRFASSPWIVLGPVSCLAAALAAWRLPDTINRVDAYAGLILFAIGWIGLFSIQRRAFHWISGISLGSMTYGVVGVWWGIVYGTCVLRMPMNRLLTPELVAHAWTWPFDVAQLFNLTPHP